jgi:hypothetical protein
MTWEGLDAKITLSPVMNPDELRAGVGKPCRPRKADVSQAPNETLGPRPKQARRAVRQPSETLVLTAQGGAPHRPAATRLLSRYTRRQAPRNSRRPEKDKPCNYHRLMLRLLLKAGPVKRFASGFPIVGVLLVAEIVAMAWTHLAMLNGAQRHRLLTLLGHAGSRPGSLSDAEREELRALIATLQPRLFLGSATGRLSPLPIPKRVLYGPRGSFARGAAAQRR